jgi:hypothetical protein
LKYQLLLARDLAYVAPEIYESLNADVTNVKRMLATLIVRLRHPRTNGRQASMPKRLTD